MAASSRTMLYQLQNARGNSVEEYDSKVKAELAQKHIIQELNEEVNIKYGKLMKDYQENPYMLSSEPIALNSNADCKLQLELQNRAKKAVLFTHKMKLLSAFKRMDVDSFMKEIEILKVMYGTWLPHELFAKQFYGDFTFGVGGSILRHLHFHERGLKEVTEHPAHIFQFLAPRLENEEYSDSNKSAYVKMLQALSDAGCHDKFSSLGKGDDCYRNNNVYLVSDGMLKYIKAPTKQVIGRARL